MEMMRDIYERATRVVAWIGLAADNSHTLIDQIVDLPLRAVREIGRITADSSREHLAQHAN